MPEEQQYWDLLLEVAGQKLITSPHLIDTAIPPEYHGVAALEGRVRIDDKDVTLWLVLDESFPISLPRFFLRDPYALGVIPHVDYRGFVCFAQEEGLVTNQDRPLTVIQEGLERTLEVLRRGRRRSNFDDFSNEFEAYWTQITAPVPLRARSYFAPQRTTREVALLTEKTSEHEQLHFVESTEDLTRYWNGRTPERITIHKALALPLEPGSVVMPPRHDGPFWDVRTARAAIMANLSESNRRRFEKLAKKAHTVKEVVVVALPRAHGGETLFGLQFAGIGRTHPLLPGGTARIVKPIAIERRDQRYLVARGGGSRRLTDKRVLLIGGGAVGGHLAFELARAGVGQITIVDPDRLTSDNGFRHVLGRDYWEKLKVDALKTAIERQLPYVVVEPIGRSIQAVLTGKTLNLQRYDTIAVATGRPTVDLWLNRQIHALEYQGICIFSWLEPLGIGGHAVRVHTRQGSGCLECLYSSPDDMRSAVEFRGAFAAPGQSFGRALSGCATLFTPYGSVDAVSTAALAVRLLVEGLSSPETGSTLTSWKGSAEPFLAEGYRLSARFAVPAEQLRIEGQVFRSPCCTVCQSAAASPTP